MKATPSGPEAGGPVWLNAYGVPSDTARLRVTPDQARQAAREFVATGHRPTCVQWDSAPG